MAAYYVVAEALTNAAKHARASQVAVTVDADGERLRLSVTDDGIGGADPCGGSGLIGLKDRVEALGGNIGSLATTRKERPLPPRFPAPPPDPQTGSRHSARASADVVEPIGIRPGPTCLAFIQRGQRVDVGIREFEVEQREVLPHALGCN